MTRFLDDPYRKIEKKGIITLFFLVTSFSNFYLIESLGKGFPFDRAKKFIDVSSKPKPLFNSYFASIFPIQKMKIEDLVTIRNKLSIFIHGFLTHTHSIGSIDPIKKKLCFVIS